MSTTQPPYRAILAAAGTLVLGWTFGYLMASPPEFGGGKASASVPDAPQMAGTRSRKAVVEPFSSSSDSSGAAGSMFDGNASLPGQFEKLIRGALRLNDHTDRAVRLREIARAISVADLPNAIENAKRLPMSDRYEVMQALGARWAEADPVAAAEFATKSGGNRHGWNPMLHGVLDKWASMDHLAATKWIAGQPEGRRANLMYALVQSVARQDPEAALQILQTNPHTYQMTYLHDQVFEHWCKRDPANAAKAAEAMAASGSRERALTAVAASWASQDPAAAIQWAESFPDANARNKLLASVAHTWSDLEPLAVIQWAGSIKEPALRQNILGGAISQLANSDVGAATEQLRGFPPGQERENLVNQVAMATAQQDPKAALALMDLLPMGPARTSATARFVTQMAATDPQGAADIFATLPPGQFTYQVGQFAGAMANGNMKFAREWVDQLTDPQMKAQGMRAVAGVLAQGDPKAAAEWLLEKEPGADLGWILNSWVRNSPTDVLAWAKDLPEGEAKRSAQATVVQSLANADVDQARKIFMKDLSPEAQVTAASQLATQWANRDVAAARAWAEALPAGGARDNALGGIARAWAKQDAAAATQWLERFPPGDERDRVVTQFAGAVSPRDPAGALAWATSITDPDLRGAQLEQLASRWLQTNPSAAREWIENAEHLTPSARRRVLEQRQQGYQPYYGGYYE